MARVLTIVAAIIPVTWVILAAVFARRRLGSRCRLIEYRFHLDPPGIDDEWILRRLRGRDVGGCVGVLVGTLLSVALAFATSPRDLTSLLALLSLSAAGWTVGQTAAEVVGAQTGAGSRSVADFWPPAVRATALAFRLLPLVSLVMGAVYHHVLAGVVVAAVQLFGMALVAVGRSRALRGREYGLTSIGARWARALHADALRLFYQAELLALGPATMLLAFYLYEFQVQAHGTGLGLLLFAVALGLATWAALIVGMLIPRWARTHAWHDDPTD